MKQIGYRDIVVLGGLCALALSATPQHARADASGVSFWLPGTFGSLAATPTVPGWAYETIYIHLQMSAGGGTSFVTSNGIRGSVVAGLNAHADALVEGVTYTSALPVLGGQAAFTVLAAPGDVGVGDHGLADRTARQHDFRQQVRQSFHCVRRVLPGHTEMEPGRQQRDGVHRRQHSKRYL